MDVNTDESLKTPTKRHPWVGVGVLPGRREEHRLGPKGRQASSGKKGGGKSLLSLRGGHLSTLL